MKYRTLGRTGLSVSQLGFGTMRLPMQDVNGELRVNRELAIPLLQNAFQNGVTYIDSAVNYCNEDSQCAVGEALKGWRQSVVVSTAFSKTLAAPPEASRFFVADRSSWLSTTT